MSRFLLTLTYSLANPLLFGYQVAYAETRADGKNPATIAWEVENLDLEEAKKEFERIRKDLEFQRKVTALTADEKRVEADKWFKSAVLGRQIRRVDAGVPVDDISNRVQKNYRRNINTKIGNEEYAVQDMLKEAWSLNIPKYATSAAFWSELDYNLPGPQGAPEVILGGVKYDRYACKNKYKVYVDEESRKVEKECRVHLENSNNPNGIYPKGTSKYQIQLQYDARCWYEIGRMIGTISEYSNIKVGGKKINGIECLFRAIKLDGRYEKKSKWWRAMANNHKWVFRTTNIEANGEITKGWGMWSLGRKAAALENLEREAR